MYGRVHGRTVELDDPISGLEGKRVRVVLEVIEEFSIDSAPLDDRPLDDEERRAIDEYRAGKAELVPHEEVRAALKKAHSNG